LKVGTILGAWVELKQTTLEYTHQKVTLQRFIENTMKFLQTKEKSKRQYFNSAQKIKTLLVANINQCEYNETKFSSKTFRYMLQLVVFILSTMYNIHHLQSHDFAINEFVHCNFKCNPIFFEKITNAMLSIERFQP